MIWTRIIFSSKGQLLYVIAKGEEGEVGGDRRKRAESRMVQTGMPWKHLGGRAFLSFYGGNLKGEEVCVCVCEGEVGVGGFVESIQRPPVSSEEKTKT